MVASQITGNVPAGQTASTGSMDGPGRVSGFRPSKVLMSATGAMNRLGDRLVQDPATAGKIRRAFGHLGFGVAKLGAGSLAISATALNTGEEAVQASIHMSVMAATGVFLLGGAIMANTAIATVRSTGTVLQTLGGLMNHPRDTLRELKQAAVDLCEGVKEKIRLAGKARTVRAAAGKVLSGYRRGNISHWLKSLTAQHTPVEVNTAFKSKLDESDDKEGIKNTAQLARLAYSGIIDNSDDRKLPDGFSKMETDKLPHALKDFYNDKTGQIKMPSGFKAVVAKNGNTVHLAFAGSEFGLRLLGSDREGTYQADYLQRFGLYSPMYRDAVAVTKLFKDMLDKNNQSLSLHLSGHSLGGGLAQFAAVANGVKATCFNAAGMSAGSLAMLGKKKVDGAKGMITHIRVKGDPVSDGGGGRLGPVQVNAKGTEIGTVITLDHPGSGGSATAHFMSTVVKALN